MEPIQTFFELVFAAVANGSEPVHSWEGESKKKKQRRMKRMLKKHERKKRKKKKKKKNFSSFLFFFIELSSYEDDLFYPFIFQPPTSKEKWIVDNSWSFVSVLIFFSFSFFFFLSQYKVY
eukprot:TRINITY_DN10224_c3_g1_i1.p2 TRINITY_DN10224_c3_g1~~TRINITY_DN10224_c3_g1_i1.p2  ORF type:complete len:120 (+),score=9.88 TRINITY_DN10224_c3_g1_i1:637-996(+)